MKQIQTILIILSVFLSMKAEAQGPADTNRTFDMMGTYYSDKFVGRKTSSGEVFKQDRYTAAHKSIKLGTLVLVTNPKNGKQVIVKVNDRCPRANTLDLTKKAAKVIGIGSSRVKVRILPSRYMAIWEEMDKHVEEMNNGTLLNAKSSKSAAEKPTAKESTEELQNEVTLFDLELTVANTRSEAQQVIDRLPMHYQGQAEMIPSNHSLMVKVKLRLMMKKERAEEVKKEFETQFPNCRLIPSKNANNTEK